MLSSARAIVLGLMALLRLWMGPHAPDRIVATDSRSPRDGRYLEQILGEGAA